MLGMVSRLESQDKDKKVPRDKDKSQEWGQVGPSVWVRQAVARVIHTHI